MIENGTESQIVVSGEIQTENLSMGDFHQYNYDGKVKLAKVAFNHSDQEYPSPNYMPELLQLTTEKKLIFISGIDSFGQKDVTRNLSLQLKKNEEFRNKEIVELFGDNQEERRSLFDTLHQEKCSNKIVLLTNLHPERIDYNFDKLIDYSRDESCVFIISMSYSLEIWKKSGKLVSDYWYEVPKSRHYSEEELQDYFLVKFWKNLPGFWNLSPDETGRDSLLSETWTIEATIARFDSIDQVNLFVSYYDSLSEFPDDRKLVEIAEALCQGPSKMIRSSTAFRALIYMAPSSALAADDITPLIISATL